MDFPIIPDALSNVEKIIIARKNDALTAELDAVMVTAEKIVNEVSREALAWLAENTSAPYKDLRQLEVLLFSVRESWEGMREFREKRQSNLADWLDAGTGSMTTDVKAVRIFMAETPLKPVTVKISETPAFKAYCDSFDKPEAKEAKS